MIRDDYMMRMIRRAAEAIARALADQQHASDEQTEAAITEALGEVVRLPVATLVMLDQDSLAPLMGGGDDGAARVVARGLRGLADIDDRRGAHAEAKRKRGCAIAIYRRVGIGEDPADREAVKALTELVLDQGAERAQRTPT
jgi:hypothetical protein